MSLCLPWYRVASPHLAAPGVLPVVLAAVLVVAGAPVIARAQMDPSVDGRLDRIERDLNMLQRQVYRGSPGGMAPQGGGGGSTSAADVEIRMERLEAQMRDLTGKVEQFANGLDQLKQRIEQVNSDLDVRFSQAGAGGGGLPPPRPPIGDTTRVASGPPPGMPPLGAVVPPPSGGGGGGLNPIFNTLSPPGSGPPRPAAPEPASIEPPSGGTINEQFNHAFGLLKQADYGAAETALRAFIDAHPNDPLAGNAHYWLGQTYFARNKYPEAASAFAEGYKRFPKGSKAPEALLYLSMSLAKADQKKNACLALAQLAEAFPNPTAAVRERAAAEKKRIGCS